MDNYEATIVFFEFCRKNLFLSDVSKWSYALSDRIKEEFYRFYPFLCRGAKNFCLDHFHHFNSKKEIYIGFENVEVQESIRKLRTDKIGSLIKIKGQVVRTHPVHPELMSGSFSCNDCGSKCDDVVQQFKVSSNLKFSCLVEFRVTSNTNHISTISVRRYSELHCKDY